MSYDLEVWSVHSFGSSALRNPDRWQRPVESQWIFSGPTWQISIFNSTKLQHEDVPEEIAQVLPGIKYRTEINLEGRRTNEALQLLQSISNHIAKSLHGMLPISRKVRCARLPA